tara:strand:+ start:398 stop:1186 length:789 start_codon:yes stop_codon:yes gene_type:complete
MYQPFAYMAAAAAGNEPLAGYSVWFDFADTSTLSLTGTSINSIVNKSDTGVIAYTFTPRSSLNVVYDAAAKALDGTASALDYSLENASIGDALLYPGGAWIYSTQEQTLVTITAESSFRGQPFGWEANSTRAQEIFFNDASGYRTATLDSPDPHITGISNDFTKDCLVFNTVYNTATSGADQYQTAYRGLTEQVSSLNSWTTGGFSSGGNFTRIGGTSRNADTFYGFTGNIYGVLQYPFALTSIQRGDLATWAVDYYGLTLQ